MKGIGKAIKRTPFTVTSKIGMAKKSLDPEFDDYQRHFTAMEHAAEKLLKDTKSFTEAVISLFTAGAGFATHFAVLFQPISGEYDLIRKNPDSAHAIRNITKYESTMEEIRDAVVPELELIDSRIVGPTKELQAVMKLIRKTLTKRDHKLTDYDRFNNSLTKLRDKKEKSLSDEKNLFKLEQDFEVATNEYEYINNAVKTDLPRFMTLATQFIEPLFNSFFYMQLNIYYLMLEKMNSFVEETKYDLNNISGSQITQEYENKRTDAWSVIENLSIIKRIISVSRLVQASRNQNSLTRSASSATSSGSSTSRLPPPPSPSHPPFKKPPPSPPGAASITRAPPPPYSSAPSGSGASAALTPAATATATKRPPPPPPPVKSKPRTVPQVQYVMALYDFAAQVDGDLSFETGDRIEIVERSESVEDWWTGRLNGQQGVFPGNFVQDT